MPDTPRLDTPHLLVTMANGTVHDVHTENPDMVAFDLVRARKGWPAVADAPFLWLSFLAYNKMKRSGVEVGKSFEDWLNSTTKVVNIDASGNESEDVAGVGPTPPAVEPD